MPSGALAQLVERLLCKQDVRSSNLLGSTLRRPPTVSSWGLSACFGLVRGDFWPFAVFLAVFSRFGRERQPCALGLTRRSNSGLRIGGHAGWGSASAGPFSCPACVPEKAPILYALLAFAPPTPSPSSVAPTSHVDDSTGSPDLVLRAVSYLRASTREQAKRAGEREGFSIPAQRQADRKSAHGMGAWVVKEFVDAGESARSAARPALNEMLEWIEPTGSTW